MTGTADRAPLVLVTAWRRRGRVWGPWERDVIGVESSYVAPLVQHGLSPVLVPVGSPGSSDALLDAAAGLVVIGGEDVHPEVSGSTGVAPGHGADAARDRWELALLLGALHQGLPVLAICRGMQLLAVALGGTLHDDIAASSSQHPAVPTDLDEALAYRHDVTLTEGSLLANVYGTTHRSVNSLHHQSVADPGPSLVVTGRSDDGAIETVQLAEGDSWCAAMQWHPELLLNGPDGEDPYEKSLFTAFSEACAP